MSNHSSEFFGDAGDEAKFRKYLYENKVFHMLMEPLKSDTIVKIEFSQGKDKDKDAIVKLCNSDSSFEIKEDKRCKDTGNIAIETWDDLSISGIDATKSEYWINAAHSKSMVKTMRVGIISVQELRSKLEEWKISKPMGFDSNRKMGKDYRALGYLISEELLFSVLKNEVRLDLEDYFTKTGVSRFGRSGNFTKRYKAW